MSLISFLAIFLLFLRSSMISVSLYLYALYWACILFSLGKGNFSDNSIPKRLDLSIKKGFLENSNSCAMILIDSSCNYVSPDLNLERSVPKKVSETIYPVILEKH